MHMPSAFARTAGLLAATIALAAPAASWATTLQDAPPATDRPPTDRPQRDRGPSRDQSPGQNPSQNPGQNPGQGRQRPSYPNQPPQDPAGRERAARDGRAARNPGGALPWMRFLEPLELTSAQKQLIEPMVADFRKAQEKFRTETMPKVHELQEAQRKEAEAGGPAKNPAVEKQIEDYMALAPKEADLQKRITAVLNPEQAEAFKAKIEEANKRAAERREAAERRGQGNGAGSDRPQRGRGDAPAGRGRNQGPDRGPTGPGVGPGGGGGGSGGSGTGTPTR